MTSVFPARATTQGRLALDLAAGPLPGLPHLRLVTGDVRGLDEFATRFAQVLVEVIGGDRSPHQLIRWTTTDVYDHVLRRSGSRPRGPRLRSQVRSVHLSRPQPGVAEVAIHVRQGQRSRAIAVRIEVLEGRWRCSALQFD